MFAKINYITSNKVEKVEMSKVEKFMHPSRTFYINNYKAHPSISQPQPLFFIFIHLPFLVLALPNSSYHRFS